MGLKTRAVSKNMLIISLISLLLAISFVFQLGMLVGKAAEPTIISQQSMAVESELQVSESHDEHQQQQYTEQLKLLNAKVAFLQAQMSRLDALGSRVVEKVKLDPEEFNFAELPPIGGIGELDSQSVSDEQILESLNKLENDLASQTPQIEFLESLLTENEINSEKRISGRPIRSGWISSFYGWRIDPFHGNKAWHKGFDFAGKEDADVVATASGIVSYAGERYGYGLLVEVTHSDGYITRYGHNKSLLVVKGDVIKKGDTIAKMGSTGRSTGPHVHYEVIKKGKHVDPKRYVYR